MHRGYEDWLRLAVSNVATRQTKLSDLRRVEKHYGDLDALYDADELQSVLDELTYSSEDARDGRANPSRLEINGNLRTSLASYRAAVRTYIRFRQEVEGEAVRLALHPDAAGVTLAEVEPERTFALERDLQSSLRACITQLEPGLSVIDGGTERAVASGRIDILARDSLGALVVIELKAVKAPRDAVAQLLAYMGDLQEEMGGDVRGVLIAPDFDPRALSAARMVPSLKLYAYSFSFNFAEQRGSGAPSTAAR